VDYSRVLLNVAGNAAAILVVLLLLRWIRQRSAPLSRLVAFGVVIRVVLGITLVAISYFQAPVLASMQLGEGFWAFALDGRSYYDLAANAVDHGIGSILGTFPSPFFLRVLAVWMAMCGVGPASAVLLNTVCYAISAALIVKAAALTPRTPVRGPAGVTVAVAALTISPALLIFSTQPLKDPLCTLLLVACITGGRLWWRAWDDESPLDGRSMLAGLLLLMAGVYGLAGIRAYAAAFVIVAVAIAGACSAVFKRSRGLAVSAGVHVAVIGLLWYVFMVGAGPYYEPYGAMVGLPSPIRPGTLDGLDRARAGFVETGGGTALETSGPEIRGLAAGTPELSQLDWLAAARIRVSRVARGLLVIFVPISLLQAASIVNFTGGRGLLFVTDVDTVVILMSIAAAVVVLRRAAPRLALAPSVVFAAALFVLTVAAVAYVVTNYGTLFRLRLLAFTPLWVLPAFLRPDGERHPSGDRNAG
jgi:hypothetical protein